MIKELLDTVRDPEFVPSLLQGSLVVILLFIFFLIPSFEPGPELAVFLATLAIVILSVLSTHNSEKREKLLRQQKELFESQVGSLRKLEHQSQNQTKLLEELSNKTNVESNEADGEEVENHDVEKQESTD